MKKLFACLFAFFLLFSLIGCNAVYDPDAENTQDTGITDTPEMNKLDAIPFADGQLYGVAYLGYEEMEDLSFYVENYLDGENLPIHYISKGEFYLIVPRYTDMAMRLYRNDIEMTERILVYEEAVSRPFIIQCNISDILAEATICFTYQTETLEFSPYISLKDGSVQIGKYGLDITRTIQ